MVRLRKPTPEEFALQCCRVWCRVCSVGHYFRFTYPPRGSNPTGGVQKYN
jgi:hypothetical protein